ncbi:NAD(P)-dependent oxidoreductase [Dactylosporangium sp. AC04546]|uniref:NAD(P)-dependent oxidoreductase n=1 Tax=Dactylosporangium sp. AC04546 TaxID=2862460 RepID=UPI001EDC9B9D|nr:NAD(P)-dependent oxidoreductase [Dactylosporangium sp. AC04546]WVK79374.1 NAD(P)-dependent oxidoreductase [Dactylosporangium sp. AC04546]
MREPVGLLGTGRMGSAIGRRLLAAGAPLRVWNRTPDKVVPLVAGGAVAAGSLAGLAACPVVFVMVSTSEDLLAVLDGPDGLLSCPAGLRVVVDCSTVSEAASAQARALAAAAGVGFVAAPVSGNPSVVDAGAACFVASGPREQFALAEPLLRGIGKTAVWVGDGEQSRLVKLCHNLYLGVMVQALAEVTALAEKSGADREAFLRFLGETVVGSEWVRRRTPALAAEDWTPTFTTTLLRKDFDLGLGAARDHEVPMALAGLTHQLIQAAVGRGLGDLDLLALYAMQAESAGLTR